MFYSTAAAGWREVNSGTADAAGTPVYHVDGLWITRNDFTNLNITFAGVLRSTPTFFPVANGSNLPFNTVYPTGSTLANSGLDTQVLKGDETTADIVWIPNAATGGWDQYYYANALPPNITAGWKQVGQGNTDKGATAFPSAFSFERRGTTANVKMIPNTVYNGL